MAARIHFLASSPDPGSRVKVAVLGAMFALSSCSILPPSLRPADEAASAAASPAAGRQPPPPLVTAPPPPPPPSSSTSEPKLFKGTGQFVNPKFPAIPASPGPQEASLNFEALDVREVAKVILGDYLKESYTVHPGVSGTVTFRTIRPIAMKDLLPTLEMLLRQNGAALVREESVYKILPVSAVRGSVSPQLGMTSAPLPQGFSVLVVPLKFVGAREMARLLEPFAADNTVRVDETRNLVVIAGSQRELRHLIDTIELFDVDWLAGYSIGLFPIKSADVKTLVGDLDRVFGAGAQSPLAGVVRVIPIERLNALLVVTTQPRYLDLARTWAERLDTIGGMSGGGVRFFVYQVRNGKAENLATLIGDLFSTRRTTTTAPSLAPGSRPTELRTTPFGQPPPAATTTTTTTPPAAATFQIPGATGTTSGEVRVIADKDTNSLLVLATPADYDVIEQAIRKLDVVPRQVLVEVMLAEVLLRDEYSFGIGWFFSGKDNVAGRLAGGLLPTTPGGEPAVPTDSGVLQIIQRAASGDVRAALTALGQAGKAQVLASPHVMVLDNQKAQIKVGDRISVQTQTQTGVSTGSGVLNSFQYLETGILLAVTPRINSGGLVTLEVNQEVSVPANDATAVNPNPTVNSRSAQTTVVVGSGESVVLGGLIREDNGRASSGIPLLSKIPILGAAFGTQSFSTRRTELVLVITPRIVSDTVQAREVTDEFRRKLPSLEGLLPKREDRPPPTPALPTPPPPPQKQ